MMKLDLTEQMFNLHPGDHLCLIYEKEPAEQMPALIPFIQQGLLANEQFIYIADDQTSEDLAARLQGSGVDVSRESDRGAFKLWTRRQWRQPVELSSTAKAEQVRRLIEEASAAGFDGIRFAVEMTWTLGPDISAAQLEHWEATLNQIFTRECRGRIVCQYNRSRMSPEAVLAALHTHPLAILDDALVSNTFYQAPLILKEDRRHSGNGKGTAEKVNWMIGQLQRSRAAEVDRAEQVRKEASQWAQQALDRVQREQNTALSTLAAIVESSDDAIISKNLDGIITTWNKSAERLFGYTAEQAIGQPVLMLIPPERHLEEPAIIRRILAGERVEHFETVRRRKDGTLVEISLTVSPLKDSEGCIVGASKIARDISDRKRSEAALREAQAELVRSHEELEQRVEERTAALRGAMAQMEEFAYSVSHDLRAPIRAMRGYARAALEDYGGQLDGRGRDFLERIVLGSTRMDRLVQDILIYSRLSQGELNLQTVFLDRLIRDILEEYPEMQTPRAQVQLQPELPPIIGHEPSLAQALVNLLNNAVKFVHSGELPNIKIWAEPRGRQVRLWIEDSGIGIKPEFQHRLFGMFERIHDGKRYEGTGIGLAIARKAIERMGGKIGVVSDGITGSRFWIQLAAAEAPAPSATMAPL